MQRTGYRAESLAAVESGWRVEGKDERQQTWFDEAQVVVVCTGYQVKSFAPLSHLPLTPVRGQITLLPASPQSENLRMIVSANGYLAPSASELHMLGATHNFIDEAVDLRTSDHAENLSKLADISPALAKSMNIDSLDVEQLNGRASVRASVPGAMPLVANYYRGYIPVWDMALVV